jgi:hypothetical protein
LHSDARASLKNSLACNEVRMKKLIKDPAVNQMTEHEKRLFDEVRKRLVPKLLSSKYRDRPGSPYYGHCYHASIAIYKLLGGKKAGYSVCKAVDDTGVSHYWVKTPAGNIIDPTIEQYADSGKTPPYKHGKSLGFRTPQVAKQLFQAIQENNRRSA